MLFKFALVTYCITWLFKSGNGRRKSDEKLAIHKLQYLENENW